MAAPRYEFVYDADTLDRRTFQTGTFRVADEENVP